MSEGLRERLVEAVRRFAYRTTVTDLKKRGVEKVNVVGLDRMVALVEEAVRRSLARSIHLGQGGPGTLAAGTKEEFIRLLERARNMERARDEAEKERLRMEEEVDWLRRELHETRTGLEEARRRIKGSVEAQALLEGQQLAQAVRTLFAGRGGGGGLQELEEDVVGLVTRHLDQEMNRSLAAAREERDEEVQLLQRRVGKLAENLERAEESLATLSPQGEVDQGISSIYKSVQGLDGKDPSYRRKSAVLKDIFQANLALREKFRRLSET